MTAARRTTGCLHHLIEEQAAKRPQAPAIRAPGRLLSYRELDRDADRFAAHLNALGLPPGSLIAVYGTPSPELLAGILGILKAGAAWWPLAPHDPPARTTRLIDQVRPAAVLCPPEHEASWRARDTTGTPLVPLDPRLPAPASPSARPPAAVNPSDLAYLLHTSGSTGTPKGVLVEHRSIVAYCRWTAHAHRTGDRVAPLPAVTRFTFDASMQQLIAPLTRGDTVWLLDEETRADPARLLDTLTRNPGSALHCVPALWEDSSSSSSPSSSSPSSRKKGVTSE